jgi:hypothetical protein
VTEIERLREQIATLTDALGTAETLLRRMGVEPRYPSLSLDRLIGLRGQIVQKVRDLNRPTRYGNVLVACGAAAELACSPSGQYQRGYGRPYSLGEFLDLAESAATGGLGLINRSP